MTQDNKAGGATERSSREIQEDIDRTRSDLDTTVDAIESKLTPGQLFEEAWGMFRSRSQSREGPGVASRMIKNHPFPSALVGLGLGWLAVESVSGSSDEKERRYATSQGRQSRGRRFRPGARGGYPGRYEPAGSIEGRSAEDDDGGMMDSVKEKAREVKGKTGGGVKEKAHEAKEWASRTKDRIADRKDDAGEGIGHLGEEARERAHQVRERADEMGETIQHQARRARRGISHAMEESPLSVGVAAFAAGLVGGLSIPSTRIEDEAMGEAKESVMHQAKETGRETMEEAKHVAVAAAEGAVHKAEEEDLTPDRMAESVREVAREAKESAKEEAEREGLTGKAKKAAGESTEGKGRTSSGKEGTRSKGKKGRSGNTPTSG